MPNPATFTCHDCKKHIPLPDHGPNGSGAAGYAEDKDGRKFCYPCTATLHRTRTIESGSTILYLSSRGHRAEVTDWAGELRFRVIEGPYRGNHNIAGNRYDCWFVGPDNHVWHGVQYGDNTMATRCKRTKRARS